MRDGLSLQVDGKQVFDMLDSLSGPDLKKAQLMALRNSANILRRQTDQNFKKTGIGMDLRRKQTIKRKDGKEVTKIRRIATVKVVRKDMIAKVHILSDYRVKWFEMGTKVRHTKGYKYRTDENKRYKKVGRWGFVFERTGKGRRTGHINSYGFFKQAQEQTERKIFENIKRETTKAIQKIANKKGRK